MTISGGSALNKDEIDRMMREAEQHAEEDKQRRDEVEVRNSAEALVYQTEKFLADNADKVPADAEGQRRRAARGAEGGHRGQRHPGDARRPPTRSPPRARRWVRRCTRLPRRPGAAAGAEGPADAAADTSDDDVVDAEIVDEDENETEDKSKSRTGIRDQGIRFTDKRRVDPETNEVRQPVTPADEPGLGDELTVEDILDAAVSDAGREARRTDERPAASARGVRELQRRVDRDRRARSRAGGRGVLSSCCRCSTTSIALGSTASSRAPSRRRRVTRGGLGTRGAREVRRAWRGLRPDVPRSTNHRGTRRGDRTDQWLRSTSRATASQAVFCDRPAWPSPAPTDESSTREQGLAREGLLRRARRIEGRHGRRDQEEVPQARARTPPGQEPGQQGVRGAVQGGLRGVRRAVRRRQAQGVRRGAVPVRGRRLLAGQLRCLGRWSPVQRQHGRPVRRGRHRRLR